MHSIIAYTWFMHQVLTTRDSVQGIAMIIDPDAHYTCTNCSSRTGSPISDVII